MRNSGNTPHIVTAEEVVPYDDNDFDDRDETEIFMRTKVKEFNKIK